MDYARKMRLAAALDVQAGTARARRQYREHGAFSDPEKAVTIYRIIPASPDTPVIAGRVHGNGGMLTGEDGLGKLRFFASTGKFGGFQPSRRRCLLPGCPQPTTDGHSHGALMTERSWQ